MKHEGVVFTMLSHDTRLATSRALTCIGDRLGDSSDSAAILKPAHLVIMVWTEDLGRQLGKRPVFTVQKQVGKHRKIPLPAPGSFWQ